MPARDPTSWMRAEYESLVAQNLDWKLRVLQGPSAPRSMVDGKSVIMLCSNNYLNLSNHPKVKRAAREAVKTHGAGSGSVRPIAGNMDLHEELERRIARFKHREAALFYVSGFAGNAGLISQLAGDGDAVLTDELNHGSIIDGGPAHEGAADHLSPLRHGRPGASPQRGGSICEEDPRRERRGVLDGRGHRAGRPDRAPERSVRGHGVHR